MRRDATPPERLLWQALRRETLNGLKFRRQAPIGRFIADFYCSSAKLVVEVDGATHVGKTSDGTRDAWLLTQGIRVFRVWNNEVMGNLAGVLAAISAVARTPPPAPSHKGRGFSSARTLP
jgi:very-short-patch-repair endonuclease